jgi:hypothetical protein
MRTTDRVLQRLRELCLSLPETSEVGSWGHPNSRAGERTFATFERIDGRPSIAFRLNTPMSASGSVASSCSSRRTAAASGLVSGRTLV